MSVKYDSGKYAYRDDHAVTTRTIYDREQIDTMFKQLVKRVCNNRATDNKHAAKMSWKKHKRDGFTNKRW